MQNAVFIVVGKIPVVFDRKSVASEALRPNEAISKFRVCISLILILKPLCWKETGILYCSVNATMIYCGRCAQLHFFLWYLYLRFEYSCIGVRVKCEFVRVDCKRIIRIVIFNGFRIVLSVI